MAVYAEFFSFMEYPPLDWLAGIYDYSVFKTMLVLRAVIGTFMLYIIFLLFFDFSLGLMSNEELYRRFLGLRCWAAFSQC